jgi:hypothetical protein
MIHAKPGQVWQCTQIDPRNVDYMKITRMVLILREEHRHETGALYLYTRYCPEFDGRAMRSHMNESPNARWERII